MQLSAACHELASGASDLVLCGGADLHNGIYDYLLFSAVHALSPTGRCRTFDAAADGISLTASLLPQGLGRVASDRIANLTGMLDAFFSVTGFHMNINVLNRDMLLDAMEHPENYPNLTIRVSGYAVNFVRLTREQQMDVINRTFHGA